MLKRIIADVAVTALLPVSALAGDRVTALDLGDLATTHIGITSGSFYEINPIFDGAANVTAAGFVGKYILRNYGGELGKTMVDAGSAFGLCNNVVVLSGAAAGAGVAAGAACAIFTQVDLPPHVPPTECERTERLVADRVCLQ